MRLPAQVKIYTLGGTIAMTSADGQRVAPALSANDLLAAVPALGQLGLDLATCDFRQIPGASLTFGDIAALHEIVRDDLAAGAIGAVITQGTDTIEETAYLLHLMHQLPEPVVVTGAMRHPKMPSPDGPANLLAAVQVAADPASRSRGCLVVMAEEIHSARYVTKAHTTATSAFASEYGPIGQVIEGRPRFQQSAAPDRITVNAPASVSTPLVGLITASLGDTGEWIENYSTGFDGLVVAGFGVGHVPISWADTLEKIAATKPVVLASRIGKGPSLADTYGFVGSESDLLARGLISSGDLGALRSRLLLQMMLATNPTRAALTSIFAEA